MRHLNFSYLVPGKLAGMAAPGRNGDLVEDLRTVREQGIVAIVTARERALDAASCTRAGFPPERVLHLYVPNMEAPMAKQMPTFFAFVDRVHAEDPPHGVAVHCTFGCGRTGTLLACYLVRSGLSADEAIARTRALRPGSVESISQRAFVAAFGQG